MLRYLTANVDLLVVLDEKERDRHSHCNSSLTDHVQHTVCNIMNNPLHVEILKGLIKVITRPTAQHCQPQRYAANMAKRNHIFLHTLRFQIHVF